MLAKAGRHLSVCLSPKFMMFVWRKVHCLKALICKFCVSVLLSKACKPTNPPPLCPGLGHSPNICHLLYDISQGILTKRNNTCTVFIERRVEGEDETVLGKRKRSDKEEEIFNNVCILIWTIAETVWTCQRKTRGRPRVRNGACVWESHFCDLLALQRAIWLRNEEGCVMGREETTNESGEV